MITRDKINITALRHEPDPTYVDYWIDLSMDPTGNVVKSFSDGRWIPLNFKADMDQWRHLQEIVEAVGLQRTEDDKIILPENDNVYFTGDSITDELANADKQLTDVSEKLDDVDEELTKFESTKGQPGGLAELDLNGTVPRELLPSYVDDVIDVYATFHVGDTGILSEIHLYEDANHEHEITEGELDKIYVNVTGLNDPGYNKELVGDDKYAAIPYQFRWSGTLFVHIDSNVLILGEITDTAFDGGRGKQVEDTVGSIDELVRRVDETPVTDDDYVKIPFELGVKDSGGIFRYTKKNVTLLPATHEYAGVMTSIDKLYLDTAATIPDKIITDGEVKQTDMNDVKLHLTQYTKNDASVYIDAQKPDLVIAAASETIAGVMTTEMHHKLYTELPGEIAAEKNEQTLKYNELDKKGSDFEAKANAYKTSNDAEISKLNELLKKLAKGAGLLEGNYEIPNTTDENAVYIKDAVSVFGAVEKLDRVLRTLFKYLKLEYTDGEGSTEGTISSVENKVNLTEN